MWKFAGLLSVALNLSVEAGAKDLSGQCGGAASQAVAFLTEAHSGASMKAEDWLTKDAAMAPAFAGFGGLKALVEQSTSRAKKFGGLKKVDVIKASPSQGGCKVTAEVKFARDHRDSSNPANAANEEMIWTFQMTELDGQWRIAG